MRAMPKSASFQRFSPACSTLAGFTSRWTMRSLCAQPSDKARFKDASEAEQALREAWERCLTTGLVPSAVLAMEEMPHDKVPPRMHEARGPKPIAAGAFSTDEVTAIASLDPGKQLPAAKPGGPKQLVVESIKNRVTDDDPTMLHVRPDEAKAKPADRTMQGISANAKSPRKSEPMKPVDVNADTLQQDARKAPDAEATDLTANKVLPTTKVKATPTKGGSNTIFIVLGVVLALVAVAAGLYYGGVIKV